jgi:hypothetical protein
VPLRIERTKSNRGWLFHDDVADDFPERIDVDCASPEQPDAITRQADHGAWKSIFAAGNIDQYQDFVPELLAHGFRIFGGLAS